MRTPFTPELVADDFIDGVIPRDAHLAGLLECEQPVLQDFLRAKLVAAMHDGDMAREIGQVKRFFDRGVAATDHRDAMTLEEETIAGGAGGNAAAAEFSSEGMPRYLADAPVAMINASQV